MHCNADNTCRPYGHNWRWHRGGCAGAAVGKATDAGVVLDNALRALRKAYTTLTDDGSTDNLQKGLAGVSRNDSARIDALSRTLDIITNLAQNPPSISLSV